MWTSTHKTNMDFSFSIIVFLLHFVILFLFFSPVYSSRTGIHQLANQIGSMEEVHKLKKTMRNDLQSINKSALKTIQSPDGDIIDCVVFDKQLAFDHSLLKEQKPLDPPEIPRGNKNALSDNFQLWSLSGESCPEETIAIRRTEEKAIFNGYADHEHSYGSLTGDIYHGAKATISVWAPHVESPNEFSLAQMWIVGTNGTADNNKNTVEAGWHVNQNLYGDNRPRLFIYWTADGYDQTGCYNLLCPGFVQTSNKIALGAAISPISTYNGGQFDITLSIYKDSKNGNWWLAFGSDLVGYWPFSLFPFLKDHATNIQFGGEITNSKSRGAHTSTQMGSGHFAEEGFRKASYIRNIQVWGSNNNLVPLSNLKFTAEKPNCYNIQGGIDDNWGNYFYYGGPGRNAKCP